MTKILKLEDVKTIEENNSKILRYVFNDDFIVRVDAKTDEIITQKVPQAYIDLIGAYHAAHLSPEEVNNSNEADEEDEGIGDDEEDEGIGDDVEEDSEDNEDGDEDDEEYDPDQLTEQERIEIIKKGSGSFGGVAVAFIIVFVLYALTYAMPYMGLILFIPAEMIFTALGFSFLDDISDKEYLESTDPKSINFQKGFYSLIVFGNIIVSLCCCAQWKFDMASVLEGNPNRYSKNRHVCFKTWFWLLLILGILGAISSISVQQSLR